MTARVSGTEDMSFLTREPGKLSPPFSCRGKAPPPWSAYTLQAAFDGGAWGGHTPGLAGASSSPQGGRQHGAQQEAQLPTFM